MLFLGSISYAFAQAPEGQTGSKEQWMKQNQELVKQQQQAADQARANANLQGAAAPPVYPKFISYPTSHKKPPYIDNEDKELARLIYDLRMQHWYFIFDQNTYRKKYGALPTNLPDDLTPAEYAQNPPDGAFSQDLERYIETGK